MSTQEINLIEINRQRAAKRLGPLTKEQVLSVLESEEDGSGRSMVSFLVGLTTGIAFDSGSLLGSALHQSTPEHTPVSPPEIAHRESSYDGGGPSSGNDSGYSSGDSSSYSSGDSSSFSSD